MHATFKNYMFASRIFNKPLPKRKKGNRPRNEVLYYYVEARINIHNEQYYYNKITQYQKLYGKSSGKTYD